MAGNIEKLISAMDRMQIQIDLKEVMDVPFELHDLCQKQMKQANVMAYFALKTDRDFPFYALTIEMKNERHKVIMNFLKSTHPPLNPPSLWEKTHEMELKVLSYVHQEFQKEWLQQEPVVGTKEWSQDRKKYFLFK